MKDFLISYTKVDHGWAEWIAWQLEEAGYTTVVQAWDFRPGSNFVLDMQRAAAEAQRTIAVLSPDYLNALYTRPEWAMAFATDPTGEKRTLLPVRVRECNLKGLLSQIVYVDLVGRNESIAKDELLKGVQAGRAKATAPPEFPDPSKRSILKRPRFPDAMAFSAYATLLLFIHGLGGNPKKTWGNFPELIKNDKELRGKFEIDFYHYPTSWFPLQVFRKMPKIQTLADGLRTEINNKFSHYESVVLICHSLGGLIARQFLIEEIKNNRKLRARKLLLYAVPNNGDGLASIAKHFSYRHYQLTQLCRNSDFINFLNDEWAREKISEQINVKYVVAALDNVVDEKSAKGFWGNENVETIVDKGHINIVKPTSSNDLAFIILKKFALKSADFNERVSRANVSGSNDEQWKYEKKWTVYMAVDKFLRTVAGNPYIKKDELELAKFVKETEESCFLLDNDIYEYIRKIESKTHELSWFNRREESDYVNNVEERRQYHNKVDELHKWFEEQINIAREKFTKHLHI